MSYRYDVEALKKWINSRKIRRLLIQAPPGLKQIAVKVAREISSEVDHVVFYGGSCWGGCDVAFRAASVAGADGILHLGHARFLEREEVPTYYLECRASDPKPLESVLEEAIPLLSRFRRVGIGVVVQWLEFLSLIEKKLEETGLEVLIGDPIPPLRYRGQVLGCSYQPLLKASNVDCFLIIGSKFHGLGLALQTKKPVYAADPEAQKILDLEPEVGRILKMRYAYIERFKRSRQIGVIASIKPGQFRMKTALRIAEILEKKGMEADVILVDDVVVEYLRDEPFEGFVNTACPRLSIEDQNRLEKPLLLPIEALIAVGEAEWEEVIRTPKYMLMEVS